MFAQATQRGKLAGARVIWSADSPVVALEKGGRAAKIASSSDGSPVVNAGDRHSVFAKEFVLSKAPRTAWMHLFAFTRYRLYVNGQYVGRGPCRYENQRPEYDSRDIGPMLRAGRNVVVALVHCDAPTGRMMRHEPGFIASLEVDRRVIGTDASWMSMPEESFLARAPAWSSVEEHLDARKTVDWREPDLTQTMWKPSEVVGGVGEVRFHPRSTPLQMETERSWAKGGAVFPMELSAGGELVLTLPEIVQGFYRLEMDAEAGSLLEMEAILPEGETIGRCSYIARSGRQTYLGGDTFAFQRLRVRLKSGRMLLTGVAATEVRYPFELVASFACSDPFLDRLWTICARSLEVLSEDAYVDCADRERVEWTDCSPPAFDCTRVMMRGPDDAGGAHWGDARLLRGLLRRIALTQQPDGQLKAHSCSDRFDIHAVMEDRTCDWVVLLREYTESTGDKALARELWPVLLRLMAWYRKKRTARGLVLAREWEVWDNPLRYQWCEGTGLNAMVYRALVDAASLAEGIGRRGDAEAFGKEARQLRADFNGLLWDEREGAYDGALFGPGSEVRPQRGRAFTGVKDGRFGPTAQANLFAMYSGIVPEDRLDAVRQWVLSHLDEVREPMSHYYLFRMLYAMDDTGQDATSLRLMRTGWKAQVESPWQTVWEDLETASGSKVHVYGMHPGYFLTAYVLGARRDGPSERRSILIEPRFSGLAWAKGVCVTECGPVPIEWTVGKGTMELKCAVPPGVQGTVRLRSGSRADRLVVDGRRVSEERDGHWLTAKLGAGKHTVRLVMA